MKENRGSEGGEAAERGGGARWCGCAAPSSEHPARADSPPGSSPSLALSHFLLASSPPHSARFPFSLAPQVLQLPHYRFCGFVFLKKKIQIGTAPGNQPGTMPVPAAASTPHWDLGSPAVRARFQSGFGGPSNGSARQK